MSKYALAKEHRDFYRDFGKIAFQDLLTSEQLKKINREIHEALKERGALSQEASFLAGRDLWRQCKTLESVVFSKKLAEIAAELCQERVLRLAFDQLLPELLESRKSIKNSKYPSFLEDTSSLQERSSLSNLAISLLLCLEGNENDETEENAFFPKKPGDGLFLRTDIPLELFPFPANKTFLWVVYAKKTSLYLRHPTDPHESELKKLGYVFGDKLADHLHPVVYR